MSMAKSVVTWIANVEEDDPVSVEFEEQFEKHDWIEKKWVASFKVVDELF